MERSTVTRAGLDAYCGLYCGACLIYQSTRTGNLAAAAAFFGRPEEGLACDGCRSNRVTAACRECWYRDCPVGKGYTSCAECPEMPCNSLKSLQTRMPHLAEIVGNLVRIHAVGHERSCAEQATRWTCPACGKTTWWYETTCAECGSPVPTAYEKSEQR
jgi:predicted RNA-binding Zn-ribbon protein involved in translation (DUF1610 family)